jgi:glycosyltransferase involved in cell wall biosynthesis
MSYTCQLLPMKLLIITQVLDTEHPILGFFHRWVEEFASQTESVEIIALQVGKYNLPPNVHVHSLGKEMGQSRSKYLWRFYRYIWQLHQSYDVVFVHMNQQYVPLGYPLWKLWGKQIGLWYAHGAVSRSLKLAVRLSDIVFTSTPQGLQLDTPKRLIVGQGIDFSHFAPRSQVRSEHEALELITVGRISASKNIETLLAACLLLKQGGVRFHFTIIGTPITEVDKEYEKSLKQYCIDNQLTDAVTWVGGINQTALPGYLHKADIFIHDGATQSLDKVLLEAVAAGCVVVSSNAAYRAYTQLSAPDNLFMSKDTSSLYNRITSLALLSPTDRAKTMDVVRIGVQANHSIAGLIQNIIAGY